MPAHDPRNKEEGQQPQRPDDDREGQATIELLHRARGGDRDALERLARRFMAPLHRWASGRLPRWARDALDTEDLVQETLLKTIRNVGEFEPRHEGAFQAYLRKALGNRIREEVRRVARRPAKTGLAVDRPASEASPLDQAIGREALERYEHALARLREEDREAIVARIELGLSYAEVARAIDKPTPDAARMAVSRALVRLAEEMGHGR
jgi:RNA polymerase sigma-70 factor (ECF subfamily)